MRKVVFTKKFRKDLRLQNKRGLNTDKLAKIIKEMCKIGTVPVVCKPHKLNGKWKDYLECHIEPDWLLIYRVDDETIYLYRTGTHPDLFE